MHIPDGFLSLPIAIAAFATTIVFWIVSFRKVKNSLDERQVPIMGLLTALFFAAQMINYPILGGTTAHLLGGASLGIILGPYAGCISMSIILVLQCLLFGDGGITALGANAFNMGVVSVFVPALLILAFNKVTKGRGLFAWIFISAFAADFLSAIFAGVELGFSVPTFQYGIKIAVSAMAINHSVIGVIEGIVTVVLIATLLKVRPDVLSKSSILKDLPFFKASNRVEQWSA